MAIITFQGRLGKNPEAKTIAGKSGNFNLIEMTIAENQPRMSEPHWRRVKLFESDAPRLYSFIKRLADDSKLKTGSAVSVSAEETYNEGSDSKVYPNHKLLTFDYSIGGGKKKDSDSTSATPASTTEGSDAEEWNRPTADTDKAEVSDEDTSAKTAAE